MGRETWNAAAKLRAVKLSKQLLTADQADETGHPAGHDELGGPMEDASRQPVRPASRSGGSAPRRRRATTGAFGDLSQLVKKANLFEEDSRLGPFPSQPRGRSPSPVQETAGDSAVPPQYTKGCQICNFIPGSERRGVYAQGVAKGAMHQVSQDLAKERERRVKAEAKVAELRKEVALLQQAMADLRKASTDMNGALLAGSDIAAQYAERERLLSMEFERQLERERQKKLKAKEEKRVAEEALRRAEMLAADRLRALEALQRQGKCQVEATKLREMHQGVAAVKQSLIAMREQALREQTIRVAESAAVRKTLFDMARQHADQTAREARPHRSPTLTRTAAPP